MNKTVALIPPALVLVIAAIRLLIVCNYQSSSAVAVAASSGAVSTLIGTLIPVVQSFLPISAVLLIVFCLFWRGQRVKLAFLATACIFASLLVSPTNVTWDEIGKELLLIGAWISNHWSVILWPVGIIVVLTILILALVSTFSNEAIDPLDLGVALSFLGFIAGTLTIVIISLVIVMNFTFPFQQPLSSIPERARDMWLPAEEIATLEGVTVGYVLGTSDGWVTILKEDDRTVIVVRSDHVSSRSVCRIGPPSGLPLVALPGATVSNIRECYIARMPGGLTARVT